MKQIKNALFIFLAVSLLPFSVIGQDYVTYQNAISQVDVKIQNIITQRKTNHNSQENINAFVAEAGKWFNANSDIEHKINQAKSGSGDYSTFNSQNLQQEIQNLEQQQKAINNLNGGVTIGEENYNSISALRNGMTEKSFEIIQLINEDEQLKNKLQSLDIERDNYVADAEKDEKIDKQNFLRNKIQYLKKKFQSNYEDYSRTSSDKINPAIWCTRKDEKSSLKCIHRNIYISVLTETYVREIRESGKKYDQNKLAEMIKNAQQQSIEVKKEATYMLREWYALINAMQQEIDDMEKRYWSGEEKNIDIDPSGCWIIGIGKGTQPVVEIKENPFEEFVGTVTNTGTIHKKYKGRVLFKFTRVNSTTFEGTEYAYTDKGFVKARIPVRIIINKNRNGIEYRTVEQILTLRPCN